MTDHPFIPFKPEVAIVVPVGHRPIDLPLLNRFLVSLETSDFPKQYLLYATVGGSYHSRRDGMELALKSGVPYILSSDGDCIVPKTWYARAVEMLEKDSSVGAISIGKPQSLSVVEVPTIRTVPVLKRKLVNSIPNQSGDIHTTTYIEEGIIGTTEVHGIEKQMVWGELLENPMTLARFLKIFQPDAPAIQWDGFVVFRREFCLDTGALDGNFVRRVGENYGLIEPKENWKVGWIDVRVGHNKEGVA